MTVLEQTFMETMPKRLAGIVDELKDLNKNLKELVKLLKDENNKVQKA